MENKQKSTKSKRNHKDGIFRLLFDSEDKIRDLYNSLEGTHYGPETSVEILTLEDAIFLDIKNDLAFCIGGRVVVLTEHQSTWNPNMPVRMLSYIGRTYERLFDSKEFYRSKQFSLPVPEFFVFYNGKKEVPEESLLKLSDSFVREAPENSMELVVKVINVRYNKGKQLLERCRLLRDYSLLISYINGNREGGMSLEDAVRTAVERCSREGVLAEFLKRYGTEVLGMLFDVVTKEEYGDILKEEGREEGREEGKMRKLVSLVCRKLVKGKTPVEIAEDLEEDTELIERICKAAGALSPEYDEEKVFEQFGQVVKL